MAGSTGPNIATDGLVFAFDTTNSKSFVGEPTENLFLNPTFLGTPGTRDHGTSGNWSWSGYSGESGWRYYDKTNSPIPLKFEDEGALITTGANDDGTTQNRRFYCHATLEPNTTYTVSVWVYYSGTGDMGNAISHFEYDDSGNGLPLNSGYFKNFNIFISENNISKGEWFRYEDTYTTGAGYERGLIGPVISGHRDNLIAMQRFQIEKKSYTTPFINGVRSTTESLLDQTKNHTINLSNVSYNGDNNIILDSTDDYVDVTSTPEEIEYWNSFWANSNQLSIIVFGIFDFTGNVSHRDGIIGQRYYYGSGFSFHLHSNPNNPFKTPAFNIGENANFRTSGLSHSELEASSGVPCMLSVRHDGTTKEVRFGLNNSFKSQFLPIEIPIENYMVDSENQIKLSRYTSAGNFADKTIYDIKFYNKYLSDLEISNHFEAIRNKFEI